MAVICGSNGICKIVVKQGYIVTVEACVPCETGSLRAPYRQTGLSFHEPHKPIPASQRALIPGFRVGALVIDSQLEGQSTNLRNGW